jgi:hypothetical protein
LAGQYLQYEGQRKVIFYVGLPVFCLSVFRYNSFKLIPLLYSFPNRMDGIEYIRVEEYTTTYNLQIFKPAKAILVFKIFGQFAAWM